MKPTKLFLTLIILISAGCRNEPVKTSEPEVINVRVLQVEPQAISIPVHASGIISSTEEMKLSFKTGGIVAMISVKEGEQVKRGEILATLNLSEINAQVNLAFKGYEKVLRDYTRTKNLYADTVATLEQMQNAATALDVAKSNLDIARFNLTHSKITAPDNGRILKQFVRSNELVASGYPVFLFGTAGKNWKIKAGLSDKDIIKINPGDSASVAIDAYPGVKFTAFVEQVGGMSNPLTGTYDIELALNDTGYRLATGFVAGVEVFPLHKETFFLVSAGSVVEANGHAGYIYSLTKSMTVKKIRVEITAIIGQQAAIKGNCDSISKIVTEGAAYLRDGVKVNVMK